MPESMALQIKNPEIDAVGQYQKGAATQLQFNAEEMRQTKQRIQDMSAMALGVMDGNIDGQPDPERWGQAIDFYQSQSGQDLSAYKDRADLAPVIARAGLDAMQQLGIARDERDHKLALQRFSQSVSNAAANRSLARERFEYGKEQDRLKLTQSAAQQEADRLAAANAPPKANSPLGKLTSDLNAGLIDQATYDAAVRKATRSSNGITIGPDGTVSIGGMPKLTEGQSKDVTYLTRAVGSNETIEDIGGNLTSLPEAVGGGLPVVGNYLKSEDYQKAEQAASEFKTSIARKDSGAAIPEPEDARYNRLYIPQPGDKDGTLKQKSEARKRAMQGIKMGLPAAVIVAMEDGGVDVNAAIETTSSPDTLNNLKSKYGLE